ncbi:MAG: hypothetical protein HY996_04325 [Micrococcales bacterium]|nr:hypothetical protein [Micrococcales bacterium]
MSSLTSTARHADTADDRYLRQLGRLVVAVSRLEATSVAICRGMCVNPGNPGLLTALAAAARRAEAGMPPWAQVRCEDLMRWSAIARRLLDERDRLLIGIAAHRFTGSEGDAARVTAPDGTVFPADERFLDRMIHRVHRHEAAGLDLRMRLEYVDAKGKNYPLGDWHLDHLDPDRAPAMNWYPDHLAQLPVEWRAWLDTDLPEQAEEPAA